MKKLNRVGFFNELRHGDPDGPSLTTGQDNLPEDILERVCRYLESGHLFIGCPALVKDVLNDTGPFIGAPNILTDGEWAWPADLVHYVNVYRVALPSAFLDHMIISNWQVPAVGLEQISL